MKPESQPLVSVLTPVYNGERDLAECIESVLAQTYQNWEYCIVNNCSTDRTLEIAQTYAKRDKRIRIHNNSEFVSGDQNGNIALRQISIDSKYCKVVHADDWIFPECLTKMVELAEVHPSVGIVGAYGMLGAAVWLDGLPYPSTVMSGRDICRWTLLGRLYVFGSPTSLLMRSDIVRASESFYNESNTHCDAEVCFKILRHWDFGFVHLVLTYNRIREGSQRAFSKRYNTYLPHYIDMLQKFGPAVLSQDEVSARLKHYLTTYYQYLARSVFTLREKEFWAYHRAKMESVGHPLSLPRLLLAVCSKAIDCLLNPKRTIEGLWKSLRSRTSPTPPKGGEPEERGDEANETQSRGGIQGSDGLRRVQGRQDAG
jgi:glycosyltransferase involved in cell wall biosynthesis